MKITRTQLRQIINEETSSVLSEATAKQTCALGVDDVMSALKKAREEANDSALPDNVRDVANTTLDMIHGYLEADPDWKALKDSKKLSKAYSRAVPDPE